MSACGSPELAPRYQALVGSSAMKRIFMAMLALDHVRRGHGRMTLYEFRHRRDSARAFIQLEQLEMRCPKMSTRTCRPISRSPTDLARKSFAMLGEGQSKRADNRVHGHALRRFVRYSRP